MGLARHMSGLSNPPGEFFALFKPRNKLVNDPFGSCKVIIGDVNGEKGKSLEAELTG